MKQLVLKLTDEEYATLAAFLARGYGGFGDYGVYLNFVRGAGGGEYVVASESVEEDPPQLAVVAAALNGLVRG